MPNNLLFSRDPVAIDCVMTDFLTAEKTANASVGAIATHSRDYLIVAENAGVGTYQTGNPWANPSNSGFSEIEYQKVEL